MDIFIMPASSHVRGPSVQPGCVSSPLLGTSDERGSKRYTRGACVSSTSRRHRYLVCQRYQTIPAPIRNSDYSNGLSLRTRLSILNQPFNTFPRSSVPNPSSSCTGQSWSKSAKILMNWSSPLFSNPESAVCRNALVSVLKALTGIPPVRLNTP
jgi:hypothetical protein